MAKKETAAAAQAVARQIGRITLVRLTLYYIFAGAILLLITVLFPEKAVPIAAESAPPTMGEALPWIRDRLALFPNGAPSWVDAVVQMTGALILVIPMAFVYVRTRTRQKYDHSLTQTMITLPIVVTAILVVVRDSLALAFSLAGIVAAVRFRNTLRESGDAVYIFGSIGIGFAAGIHALAVATVLSLFFVVTELVLWKVNLSAEFEHTFARLCLPSGADLAAISAATGELPAAPQGGDRHRESEAAEPDGHILLRLYVDQVEQARPLVETILERDTKRWRLEATHPSDGGPAVLDYRIRPRKRVDLDTLRDNLLREGAPHVVATDDASVAGAL